MLESHQVGRAALVTVLTLSYASLVACSPPDVHDDDEPPVEWSVTNTSEDFDAQVIVHNETGIEYIAILLDDERNHAYGFCERYGHDGNIMHDGDPTMGGSFGFELVESISDDSGTTKVFKDRQTGVAYRWHKWSNKNGGDGQGLSVCRDKSGRIQRWDDGMFIPVSADAYAGDTDTEEDARGMGTTESSVANDLEE